MRIVRIGLAAFMVLLGAMVLVGWSVAGKAVAGIEDGSAVTKLTQKMLDDPDFADAAAGRITDRLVEQTDGRFIGRIVVAFEPELQRAIANVLSSDRVEEAVTTGLERLESRLTEEITEPDRPSGPLVISVDLSDRVNNRIDQIPVVGTFIPEVTVPPIEREVMDAATFDSVRQVYSGLKFVSTWGLIFSAALIIGGFFVAPRSRWYWPQALIGTAFIVLAISIAVRRIIPAKIADAVPGGETGGGGTFLSNFVADNATGPLATRLLTMAVWAFLLAVAFAVIARFLPGWKEQVATSRGGVAVPDAAVAYPEGVDSHESPADEAAPAGAEPADAVIVEETLAPDTSVTDAVAAQAVADAVDGEILQSADEPTAADIVAVIDTPVEVTLPDEPALPDETAVVAPAKRVPRTPAAKAAPAKVTATKPAKPAAKPAVKKPAAAEAPAVDKPAPRSASRARKPAPPKE